MTSGTVPTARAVRADVHWSTIPVRSDCRMPLGAVLIRPAGLGPHTPHHCPDGAWCDARTAEHQDAQDARAAMKDRAERDLADLIRTQYLPTDSRLRWIAGAVRMGGYAVHESAYLRDGEVWQIGGHRGYGQGFVIGTRPWTDTEVAVERGRRAVRHGLADVLAWLGEKVGPGPDEPIPAVSGRSILEQLRRAR